MKIENRTILEAYENNKKAGNTRLDFNDVIWDEDIKPIADTLRKSGTKEFTISVRQGNMIELLAAFQELGIFVKGIVQVKTRYTSWNGEGREIVPAILMQVA